MPLFLLLNRIMELSVSVQPSVRQSIYPQFQYQTLWTRCGQDVEHGLPLDSEPPMHERTVANIVVSYNL
jgi:hypothetical protein